MRLQFKHLLLAGIALAATEMAFKLASHRSLFHFGRVLEVQPPLPVQARSITSPPPNAPAAPGAAAPLRVSPIGAVLASDNSPTAKAITLLERFPHLPPPEQVEVAQHTSRLLADDYYAALGAQLTNALIAPDARRVLFADLLTRRATVKLPWLVAVASAELDGESAEAMTLLKSVLRADHGTDWAAWRAHTATWLSLHPE
ncbi:MAG TPA: hypothetical protein PKN95_05310 [Verrucomicrobiota bacterium]|nr:hypothetical protein [Verrucomicrobiota bacterium]HNT13505.1 hypothetical protein [Verrucomicrobiota bacterium]